MKILGSTEKENGWYHIDSASRDIPYGTWSKEKPEWVLPKLATFKTKIENDGRVANGEFWWEIQIQIKTLKELRRLTSIVGKVVFENKQITVYDDYLE